MWCCSSMDVKFHDHIRECGLWRGMRWKGSQAGPHGKSRRRNVQAVWEERRGSRCEVSTEEWAVGGRQHQLPSRLELPGTSVSESSLWGVRSVGQDPGEPCNRCEKHRLGAVQWWAWAGEEWRRQIFVLEGSLWGHREDRYEGGKKRGTVTS